MADTTGMKVIPHPNKPGAWTIVHDGKIYGTYDRKEAAIATILTRRLSTDK